MKRNFLALAIGLFILATGCATIQLENGAHPNRTANGAVIGATLGSVPGIILRNKAIGIAGALAGGAVGSWVGSRADQKIYEDSRLYREKIREEWKETYARLSSGTGGDVGTKRSPTVMVMIASSDSRYSHHYGRGYDSDWRTTAFTAIEQGLRQRGFVLPYQFQKEDYGNYRRGYDNRNVYAANTDFVAEVLLQDLGSSIKAIVTLRSLRGLNNLDRQGVGQVNYDNDYNRRYGYDRGGRNGPSLEELRDEAATLAAKKAILNLFTSPYADTLDSVG